MENAFIAIVPLLLGYLLDLAFGDPYNLPHPVRLFGNLIGYCESKLNGGKEQFLKGSLVAVVLVAGTFIFFYLAMALLKDLHVLAYMLVAGIFVFYGIANRSLIDEGRKVFFELQEKGIDAGRKRLSWIVGRDTSNLSAQQIRVAVFETMSENLSDGVIAPLFYYLLLGVPGIMAYKMINTLDSMIGYRNQRYEQFGKFAARMDDVANYIPARLTAILMVSLQCSYKGLQFIRKYGNKHKSPNSGYPEAALAGILDVRFGGPNVYHGVMVDKPFIGENPREIEDREFGKVARINHVTTLCMVIVAALLLYAAES